MTGPGKGLLWRLVRNENATSRLKSAAEKEWGCPGSVRKGSWWGLLTTELRALPASHLLLGILCKCRQTGFAGPTAVVGRGSCLLQLAPVRVEEPHSFGAPHVVPARVSETGKSDSHGCVGPPQHGSSQALPQYFSPSTCPAPKSTTYY